MNKIICITTNYILIEGKEEREFYPKSDHYCPFPEPMFKGKKIKPMTKEDFNKKLGGIKK